MPKKRSKPDPQPGDTRVEFGVFGPRQFESAEAFSAGPEDFGGSDEGSHLMAQERVLLGADIPVGYPDVRVGIDLAADAPEEMKRLAADVEAKSAAQFGERLRSMVNTQERRDFVDRAAIAIYANGWPAKNVYARAMLLWELRQGEIERGRL